MARSTVSPEVRAAALADLYAGEQPAVVAERYGISANTVKQWKKRYVTDIVTVTPSAVPIVRPAVEAQQRQIGAIVLDLLRAKLEASAAIAEHARHNPAWLNSQSAAELAVFGQWLDGTALAIGDRLAGARSADDSDPSA